MKIECVKEKLEEVVAKATRFTGKNETLPVLECILFEARDNDVVLRATNLELGVEVALSAKVSEKGTTAVPASVLRNLLAGLENEKKVALETSHENLLVTSRKNTSLIKSFEAKDFPTIPRVNGNEVFELSSGVLKEGFGHVSYSASRSPVKPELSSVYCYQESGELVFVATDSFRLAEKRIPLKKSINFSSTLIPAQNLSEVVRVFDGANTKMEVNAGKNQVAFEGGGVYVTSRVVDGTFPDYRQLIPGEFSTEVVVLAADLSRAVKVTNIFSDQFSKVALRVSASDKRFEVEANNADVGENTTALEAKISGEDVDRGFNYRYILDAFQSLSDDSVVLGFSGEGKAMVMRGAADNSFTYLVMPMNK